MANILTIGEAMGLLVSQKIGKLKDASNFKKFISGAEVNVSIGATRLGHNVSYFTQLGKDPIGDYIIDFLKKENINTENIKQINEYNTGIQLKGKTEDGDPEISYYRRDSAASKMDIENLKNIDFSKIDLLHITGIFMALNENTYNLVLNLIKKSKENGVKISFDPNLRPALWNSEKEMIKKINYIASLSDYFLPGLEEAKILTKLNDIDNIADFYLKMGCSLVIFKVGSKGSVAYLIRNGDKIVYRDKGFNVKRIVDTVGAGDGFAVGIITGILENLPIEEILERANAIGAIQITNQSDNEGLPNREELKKIINSRNIE